jgi:hypothetical protein
MDRNAAKGTAPLDHAAIEVRVRGADRRYAPEGPHLLDGLIIDEALAVPKNVAGLGLDQQRTLADPELRGRADPSQVPLVRAHLAVKTFSLQGAHRCPPLPMPAHVLALVLADGAAIRRALARLVLNCTGPADEALHP